MIWNNGDEQQIVWTILGPEKDFKGIAENDDVSVDNDASKHSTEEGVKVDIGEKLVLMKKTRQKICRYCRRKKTLKVSRNWSFPLNLISLKQTSAKYHS